MLQRLCYMLVASNAPPVRPAAALPRLGKTPKYGYTSRFGRQAQPPAVFTRNKEIRSVRITLTSLSAIAAALWAGAAAAYVGPGAGISVLGALWGLIVGVVMAVGVILFWPIRTMLRKKKAAKAEAAAAEAEQSGEEEQQSSQSS